MAKKSATASRLQAELDRRIRERARGPYSSYASNCVPLPVPLEIRDASGCNWTVVPAPTQPAASLPFLDLIVSQLMMEYDLVPG
jgi:hypothetical protein